MKKWNEKGIFREAPDCPQIIKIYYKQKQKNENKQRTTNLGLVSCQKCVRLWLHGSVKYISCSYYKR